MPVRTFTAVIHKEDDLYVADCLEAGTVSQGCTIEEAVANLKEATELFLEEFPLPGTNQTFLATFEETAGEFNGGCPIPPQGAINRAPTDLDDSPTVSFEATYTG